MLKIVSVSMISKIVNDRMLSKIESDRRLSNIVSEIMLSKIVCDRIRARKNIFWLVTKHFWDEIGCEIVWPE